MIPLFEILGMKLIIIDGGPASGKNTLGALLLEKFRKLGNKAVLLDLDTYVEKLNPKWVWANKKLESKDKLKARETFARDIEQYLRDSFDVIMIGEKFLSKDHLFDFLNKLRVDCNVYLYHLIVPLSLRRKRLKDRGPHSLIDFDKDQKERDAIRDWPGYIYKNFNSPEEDALNLFTLIQNKKGFIYTRSN